MYNETNVTRDEKSKAVLVRDNSSLRNYKKAKAKIREGKRKIASLEERLAALETKVNLILEGQK